MWSAPPPQGGVGAFGGVSVQAYLRASAVTLSDVTGISVWDYMWDTSLGIGWVGGLANPTGVALLVLLFIIVAFSHRIVRKSGYFEVRLGADCSSTLCILW